MKEFIIKVDTDRIQRFMDEHNMNRFQFIDFCDMDGCKFWDIIHFWTPKFKDTMYRISKVMGLHIHELFIVEHIEETMINSSK